MLNVDTATMSEDADDSTTVEAKTEVTVEIDMGDIANEFDNEPKTQTDVWAMQPMKEMVYGLSPMIPENANLRFDVE